MDDLLRIAGGGGDGLGRGAGAGGEAGGGDRRGPAGPEAAVDDPDDEEDEESDDGVSAARATVALAMNPVMTTTQSGKARFIVTSCTST